MYTVACPRSDVPLLSLSSFLSRFHFRVACVCVCVLCEHVPVAHEDNSSLRLCRCIARCCYPRFDNMIIIITIHSNTHTSHDHQHDIHHHYHHHRAHYIYYTRTTLVVIGPSACADLDHRHTIAKTTNNI